MNENFSQDKIYNNTDIRYNSGFISEIISWGLFIFVFSIFVLRFLGICNNSEKITKRNLKDYIVKENEEVCSICIENMKTDHKLKILKCNHYFHEKCIMEWLKNSEVCPLCRCSDIISNI
jgi:hypothetical protein